MKRALTLSLLAGALAAAPDRAAAQDEQEFLAVGEMAPDIEFVGATRYGVVQEPVSLSDFSGNTIILAFFFRARSSG
jgi:ABC-type sugar transport system substrate-binding protein